LNVIRAAGGKAVPVFVSSSVATAALTPLVITKPAGITAGDLLIASVEWAQGGTITPPAGWSLVFAEGTEHAVYQKIATGSEPASYSFTFSVAANIVGAVLDYTPTSLGCGDGVVGSSSAGVPATAPSATTFHVGTSLILEHVSAHACTAATTITVSTNVNTPTTRVASTSTGGIGATGLFVVEFTITTAPPQSPAGDAFTCTNAGHLGFVTTAVA
jgi:hypothetical protein